MNKKVDNKNLRKEKTTVKIHPKVVKKQEVLKMKRKLKKIVKLVAKFVVKLVYRNIYIFF